MPAELTSAARALTAVAALLLAGCWSSAGEEAGTGSQRPAPPPVSVDDYVALGDSFTSAPLVPDTDLAEGCFRSDGNYPALLAERLQPDRFVDVSCSAATSDELSRPQSTAGGNGQVPPQLRAVRPDTDLVTLGIGANDENLFARLITCVRADAGRACSAVLSTSQEVLDRTSERLTEVLRRITREAPEATVVLVGYPRLLDPETPCDLVPAPPTRLDDLAELERTLNRSLQVAADRAGVEFLDMYDVSAGHEICSDEPWVNGRRSDEARALAFHPFASGQQAVADRLLQLLVDSETP